MKFYLVIMSCFILVNSYSSVSNNVYSPYTIRVGNQYYEDDIDGLRVYLETLKKGKKRDAKIYNLLNSELEILEKKRLWSNIVFYGGILLAGYGSYQSDQEKGSNKETSRNISGAGIAGMILGRIFYPNRGELYSFVNKHNKYSPKKAINWSVTPFRFGIFFRW